MTASRIIDLRRQLDKEEKTRLSLHACLSTQALRRNEEPMIGLGHRQFFSLDADRVMHSLAYTRYIDKTQVFSLVDNDQITHRVLHVQLVSKIARTIGRFLRLNEDLIEAIALAHDIGHPPFGHDGEKFLAEKCRQEGLGGFQHNLQSVRFLEKVEKGGRGLNLSLQVLDGVLCHDGEVHSANLTPVKDKTFSRFDREIKDKEEDPSLPVIPMTTEGCVVRISDTISYIGRDLEDAILLGLVKREDLPEKVVRVLGRTNGTMVYRLVEDLIENSRENPRVRFSEPTGEALKELKDFNLERIYLNPKIKTEHDKIRQAYHRLFESCLDELKRGVNINSTLSSFLKGMLPEYLDEHPAVICRDFISGMTDEYFLRCCQSLDDPPPLPKRLGSSF
ncbi:deoxyguanosinetriphosphate triphosphohydrolase family protein [Dethiosulfatarculus sandiegensis]|uniref:Phosphohydrolase n=1 Tax=Dethiosulfatarculus sandiegensis TaxID=1429043 RepID=A0A0D2J2F8_9BACT|nr:HD domain-containing protein [Dethiosulfatarculus sandiegensis]KIX12394.1 phosphohydrolase [Dethiosulfatarculus sandiegensis]